MQQIVVVLLIAAGVGMVAFALAGVLVGVGAAGFTLTTLATFLLLDVGDVL